VKVLGEHFVRADKAAHNEVITASLSPRCTMLSLLEISQRLELARAELHAHKPENDDRDNSPPPRSADNCSPHGKPVRRFRPIFTDRSSAMQGCENQEPSQCLCTAIHGCQCCITATDNSNYANTKECTPRSAELLKAQEDSPLTGFICPDCKHVAATPEELIVHYETHLVGQQASAAPIRQSPLTEECPGMWLRDDFRRQIIAAKPESEKGIATREDRPRFRFQKPTRTKEITFHFSQQQDSRPWCAVCHNIQDTLQRAVRRKLL
jgi:hypothetical protein